MAKIRKRILRLTAPNPPPQKTHTHTHTHTHTMLKKACEILSASSARVKISLYQHIKIF